MDNYARWNHVVLNKKMALSSMAILSFKYYSSVTLFLPVSLEL